jgi:hypothetical protein
MGNMSCAFNNEEYADMHFVYGFCDKNTPAAFFRNIRYEKLTFMVHCKSTLTLWKQTFSTYFLQTYSVV